MDFITGLPEVHGRDCIYVVVDRLSKFTHFVMISSDYESPHVVELFFREVFRLHGLPAYIVSDRDRIFFNAFWQESSGLTDKDLTPSTLFPPDGCIQKQEPKTWLIWIPMVISVAHRESVGIGDGGFITWLWDLGSHMICRSLQSLILVGRVVTMIGLFHFWNVMRGYVETYYIGWDIFSFLIPRIKFDN
jgi:hypothetical protein